MSTTAERDALAAALTYPLGDTLPATGTVHWLAPDVGWLRMPLPFALDHINLWLLRDGEGWTIVDSGVATQASKDAWEQIFAHQLQGLPVRRVLATHCHPDHIGLAGWLCQRWQVALWTSAGEYAFARMMSAALPGVDNAAAVAHFQRHGLHDAVLLEQMSARKNYYPSLVPAVPASYTRLQDGQQLTIGTRVWQVVCGYGHSPEHVALYCEKDKLLIAGDMVLPRISTNVSVFAIEPEANPLTRYLESLDKFAKWPNDVLVLPSHGKPFQGLHQRIIQLREHHRDRLAEVLQACQTAQSAASIVPLMFRRALDAHQLSFALGEALAHLHALWYDGLLQRVIAADGSVLFQRVESECCAVTST